MKSIRIVKTDKSLKGVINLPSSKSISNRLLIIRAISGGDFAINNLSVAEDTALLEKLLHKISLGGNSRETVELDCANTGTNLRFLASFAAARRGRWMLTGTERMKQRPVGELVENLKLLGAEIEYLGNTGFPPLLIKGRSLKSCNLTIDAGVSSQFISSLLMISPYLPDGLTLDLKGDPVSEPYTDMTIRLMKDFGIEVRKWKHRIRVEPGRYTGREYTVESDWSAASFWYMAAALSNEADLQLPGLLEKSLQGDSVLSTAYDVFGVRTRFVNSKSKKVRNSHSPIPNPQPPDILHLTKQSSHLDGFYYDFIHHPDLALPMIATCAALGIRGRFEGLKSLVIKETDRIQALSAELQKLGYKVSVSKGEFPAIELSPSKLKSNPETVIDTYRDHRMAMTFAMFALKTGSIRIADPDVVVKSYPGFWNDMEALGFELKG
jgi:3-phosphoshikimate 1-carboxyvinyltransferase